MKIIAIDFDDTITLPSNYPITGKLNPKAKKYIELLAKNGYECVLWTSRSGEYYEEACNLIKQWKLPISFDTEGKYIKGSTGKLNADFYIDDRSCIGKLNWKKIYKYIMKYI